MSASFSAVGSLLKRLWANSKNSIMASRYEAMVRGLNARCATKYSVKNSWTNNANDTGCGAVISDMAYLLYLSKCFEFICRHCHELRYTSEIPVGVGYHGVPHVGGQRQHLLI